MRLRAMVFAVLASAAVGALVWTLAEAGAAHVERGTAAQVAEALEAADQSWVTVTTDGLIVGLAGEAADETSRFRALDIVARIVDPRRIADNLTVRVANPVPPPAFALELLRNNDEVSLIGLVPAESGRSEIAAALARAELDGAVTDMLETAAHAAPAGWADSLAFGLKVLGLLPRAKISVEPGRITVLAVADSDGARSALENRLAALRPAEVALDLQVSAPRPVIAPFVLDFSLSDGQASFAACSAESPEAIAVIAKAGREAGFQGTPACDVGLGSPAPDWAAAVASGIAAVREMGGGRFRISDMEAVLTGPDGIDAERLRAIGARLDATLPAVLALSTVAPPQMAALPGGGRVYAPEFAAALLADGTVRLTGPLRDELSRSAIESYAAALFGHAKVTSATVIDPGLPEGWPGRVLAGVEALSMLKEGKVEVTPQEVAVAGWGVAADGAAAVETLLAAKQIGGAVLDIRFDAAAAEIAARSPAEVCAETVAGILSANGIAFQPGSSTLEDASGDVITAIAAALRGCPGAAFEIAGHTDSQGRAEVNQRISEARAAAVLAALEAEDLPLVSLTAVGRGATVPIADNTTEEGRARNRRIEFSLVVPEAATLRMLPPVQEVSGEPG